MSPAEKYDEFFDDSDFKQEAQRFLKLNSKYSILAITNVESMSFFVYQLQSSNWRVTKKSIRESMLLTLVIIRSKGCVIVLQKFRRLVTV